MWKKLECSEEQQREFKRLFQRKARFLVDENMGESSAELLRSVGYNAVFVADIGLRGVSDEAVFAFAWKDRRMLLTHDRDFLDDRAFPFHRNPGVIVLPGAEGDGSLEVALVDVVLILAPYIDAHWGAKIEVSQDRTWTIRHFIHEEGRHLKYRVKLGAHGECFEWIDE